MMYLGLGVEIAASIAVPLLLGYWADTAFGTFPWLTLAGVAIGISLFFVILFQMNSRLGSKDDSKKESDV